MNGAVILVLVIGFVALVMYQFGTAGATSGGMYCPNCGSVGTPRNRTKGSFWIELILWLCFLVPGLLYSVWRLTTKEAVCPKCGAPHMIPADSPKARAALTK